MSCFVYLSGVRLFLYVREVTQPAFTVDDAIHGQLGVQILNQLKVNGEFSYGNGHAGSWNEARESLFLLCTRVGIRATSLLAVA